MVVLVPCSPRASPMLASELTHLLYMSFPTADMSDDAQFPVWAGFDTLSTRASTGKVRCQRYDYRTLSLSRVQLKRLPRRVLIVAYARNLVIWLPPSSPTRNPVKLGRVVISDADTESNSSFVRGMAVLPGDQETEGLAVLQVSFLSRVR